MESPSSVIPLLRQATARSHRDIEDLLQLESAELGRARYTLVIKGFALFLPAWEAEVAAALPMRLRPWFAKRSRLPFLERDLEALPDAAPAPDADDAEVPPLTSLAAAFGSMYVMEGSALGGQLIARQVAARFGIGPDNGAAYFTGWGPRTGTLWREFRERIEAEIGPLDGDRKAACKAALQTFAALGAVFRSLLPAESAAAAATHDRD
jgi:heme oxygenase